MTGLKTRGVQADDFEACVAVEHIAFSSEMAAPESSIRKRMELFPQGFYVAIVDGRIVGHVMSAAIADDDFTNKDLKAMVGHTPDGKNLVIFSVAVLPEMQGRGIATWLMKRYLKWAWARQYEAIYLICQQHLLGFYESFGFIKLGKSESAHGGVEWYDMRYDVPKQKEV